MLVEPHLAAQSGVEHGLPIFLRGPLNGIGYWTIRILLLFEHKHQDAGRTDDNFFKEASEKMFSRYLLQVVDGS